MMRQPAYRSPAETGSAWAAGTQSNSLSYPQTDTAATATFDPSLSISAPAAGPAKAADLAGKAAAKVIAPIETNTPATSPASASMTAVETSGSVPAADVETAAAGELLEKAVEKVEAPFGADEAQTNPASASMTPVETDEATSGEEAETAEAEDLPGAVSGRIEGLAGIDQPAGTGAASPPVAARELAAPQRNQTAQKATAPTLLPPPEGPYTRMPAGDPTMTMPASAAGSAAAGGLKGKAGTKAKALVTNDDTVAPNEPSVPLTAMTTGSQTLQPGTVPLLLPPPIGPYGTLPAATTTMDPSASMPAPAAGPAEADRVGR